MLGYRFVQLLEQGQSILDREMDVWPNQPKCPWYSGPGGLPTKHLLSLTDYVNSNIKD